MNEKELNQKRLAKLIEYGKNCEEELRVIGLILPKPVKYEITNRTTKCWGKCVTCPSWDYIIIRVSGWLLDDEIPERTLHQHVLHELAHGVDENKHGHKGKWLEYAELISDCYAVDIKPLVTDEQRDSVKDTETYQKNVVAKRQTRSNNVSWEFMCYNYCCEKYGHAWRYKRMPKWMNHGFNSNDMTARGAKCPYCKGKLTITRWTDKLNVLPMYFD